MPRLWCKGKQAFDSNVLGKFFAPFLSTPPLSLLGQQDKSQFLAAGANAGPLTCGKCFC